MVLESKGEKTFKMVLQLLKFLCESSIITVDQTRRVMAPPGASGIKQILNCCVTQLIFCFILSYFPGI